MKLHTKRGRTPPKFSMFKRILVAIISSVHSQNSFDFGLNITKITNAELSVIECIYGTQPTFYFFETKADKQKTKRSKEKMQEELEKWKDIAIAEGIKIKTKAVLTDSISNWLINYIKENKIDLVIMDYPKISQIEASHYDFIISKIHHQANCHVLTTKQYEV